MVDRGRGLGLNTDNANRRTKLFHRRCHAGCKPSATNWNNNVGYAGQLLQDLESQRALSKYDKRIVVGRNKRIVLGVPRQAERICLRFVVVCTFDAQVNGVLLNRFDFRLRSRRWHNNRARQFEQGCGSRNSLAVVSGRHRKDRTSVGFFRQLEKVCECTSNFERMRMLKVFELEKKVADFAGNDGCRPDVRLNARSNVPEFRECHSSCSLSASSIHSILLRSATTSPMTTMPGGRIPSIRFVISPRVPMRQS